MRRHVVIVEMLGHGHRLSYVRVLANAASATGARVSIMVPNDESIDNLIETHLAHLEGPSLERISTTETLWQLVSRQARECLVVVPDGDRHMSLRWIFLQRPQVNLLLMRPSALSPGPRGALVSVVKKIASMSINMLSTGVQVFNLTHAADSKSRRWFGPTVTDPAELVVRPDVVEAMRDRLDLDRETTWFAILGAITRRKNVEMALQALAIASRMTGIKVGLIACGQPDPWSQNIIEGWDQSLTGVKVRRWFGTLTDGELDAAIVLSKAVLALHANDGPSGIIAKARLAGTNVIAAGGPILKQIVEADSLGYWSPLTVDAVAFHIATVARIEASGPIPWGSTVELGSFLELVAAR